MAAASSSTIEAVARALFPYMRSWRKDALDPCGLIYTGRDSLPFS